MARYLLIVTLLLVSIAILTSADADGCRGYGNGLCKPGGKGFCRGRCVQTGTFNRPDCDCWEQRGGRYNSNRGRNQANGWNQQTGWGQGWGRGGFNGGFNG